MSSLHTLAEYFAKFPGIGPRQAKRFVYFLLRQDPTFLEELARLLKELNKDVAICPLCRRYFSKQNPSLSTCSICTNSHRDETTLMLVEKDIDLDNVERVGTYGGYYFVMGGTIPVAEQRTEHLHLDELEDVITKRAKRGLKEIILAFSASPDGENTTLVVRKYAEPLAKKHGLALTTLGRGLSTGLELEYSDPETINNALKNRA